MTSNGPCWLSRLILFVAAIALGACSTVQSPAATADSYPNIGCDIDATGLCQSHMTGPYYVGPYLAPYSGNQHALEEESYTATSRQGISILAPRGSEVDVACYINRQQHKVIYADAVANGMVSEEDRHWLRKVGYCKDVMY